MDIYRPHGIPGGKLLPVMVWLHGGALTQGAASHYPGTGMVNESSSIVNKLFLISIAIFLNSTIGPPSHPNIDQLPACCLGFPVSLFRAQFMMSNKRAFLTEAERRSLPMER